MTLSEMQSMVYDDTGYDVLTVDARTIRRVLANLNETHRRILAMKGMSRLRRSLLTSSSVADSPYFVLPQSASKILAISDRTNGNPLHPLELPTLRLIDPGLDHSSGTPTHFLIDNLKAAVKLEPSNASELFFKSDAAGDGATKEMFIQGIITGGELRSASAAMNGTTAVSFAAAITTWIAVTKIYLALAAGGATTAAGNITIHEDSGVGTELGRILPGKTATRYTRLQLYPVPTAVVTYHVDVELDVLNLAEAGDESLLPDDFAWLLAKGAAIKEYIRKREYSAVTYAQKEFKQGIDDLRSHVLSIGGQPIDERMGISQLGPWFPAGS